MTKSLLNEKIELPPGGILVQDWLRNLEQRVRDLEDVIKNIKAQQQCTN